MFENISLSRSCRSHPLFSFIYRKELDTAEDLALEKDNLVQEFSQKFANPYVAAEKGFVDEVIMPRETRQKLICALNMLENKKDNVPPKKHGNIPL